jgi:hypothetical protein
MKKTLITGLNESLNLRLVAVLVDSFGCVLNKLENVLEN